MTSCSSRAQSNFARLHHCRQVKGHIDDSVSAANAALCDDLFTSTSESLVIMLASEYTVPKDEHPQPPFPIEDYRPSNVDECEAELRFCNGAPANS